MSTKFVPGMGTLNSDLSIFPEFKDLVDRVQVIEKKVDGIITIMSNMSISGNSDQQLWLEDMVRKITEDKKNE